METMTQTYTPTPQQSQQQQIQSNVTIPQNMQLQKEVNQTFEQDPYMQSYTQQQLGAVDKMGELKSFADELTNKSQEANQQLAQQISQRNQDIRQQAALSPTDIQGMLAQGPVDIGQANFDQNRLLSPFVASEITSGQSQATGDAFDLATQMRGARGQYLGTELENILNAFSQQEERRLALSEAEKDRLFKEQEAQKDRDFKMSESDLDRTLAMMMQNMEDYGIETGGLFPYLTKEQETKITDKDAENRLSALSDVNAILDQAKELGVMDASWLGSWIKGTTGPVAQFNPLSSEKNKAFRTLIENFADNIRKERYGAALTESELARAKITLPSKGDNEADIAKKLNAIMEFAISKANDSLNSANMSPEIKQYHLSKRVPGAINKIGINENGDVFYKNQRVQDTEKDAGEDLVEQQLLD